MEVSAHSLRSRLEPGRCLPASWVLGRLVEVVACREPVVASLQS